MDTLDTPYGVLQGIVAASSVFYADGRVKKCSMEMPNEIKTPAGVFVPRYADDGSRRKYIHALSFYKSGYLESMDLQDQQEVHTQLGPIPAEHIVLYESGQIKRIFPLNGRITGYWSEEDEYGLAPVLEIPAPFGTFKKKIMGLSFYEDGALKSITFWPQDSLQVPTPMGMIETRTGMAFYPQGAIKSLEPKYPTPVATPIGTITAWNANVLGVHGDSNSLCFAPDGTIQSLVTSTDQITVRDAQGAEWVMQPGAREGLCDERALDIVPLRVDFAPACVRFNGSTVCEYTLAQHTFTVLHIPLSMQGSAGAWACGLEYHPVRSVMP